MLVIIGVRRLDDDDRIEIGVAKPNTIRISPTITLPKKSYKRSYQIAGSAKRQ